jgi:protein-disulfide isomerase
MGDAEGQLGQGNSDSAVDAQGRALEALRRGAQSLAQQMQQGQGQGQGPGQPGRTGQARANQDTDPLGRPLRGRDYGDDVTVKVPGEIDVQRARRILEELRKRFADPARPQLELDYIERLLKDF